VEKRSTDESEVDGVVGMEVVSAVGLTECYPATIFHGSYDRGSNPSLHLFSFVHPVTGTQIIGMVEIHEGLPTDEKTDYGNCGISFAFDGLVLDAWPLQ